jgi:hypothetical protein
LRSRLIGWSYHDSLLLPRAGWAEYPDLQGTVQDTLAEARREAARFAGSLLSEKPETFWQSSEWIMRVTDDRDLTLSELRFFATEGATGGR